MLVIPFVEMSCLVLPRDCSRDILKSWDFSAHHSSPDSIGRYGRWRPTPFLDSVVPHLVRDYVSQSQLPEVPGVPGVEWQGGIALARRRPIISLGSAQADDSDLVVFCTRSAELINLYV